jgi:hypothetical protein
MAPQTLSDLQTTLPNGFHDAKLSALAIDYANGEVRCG